MHNIEKFWCGTEASFEQYIAVLKARAARDPSISASTAYGEQPEAQPLPRLLTMQGAVAVVSISGPLVNNDSPWNRYDGVTGYGEIRAAMIHAATDPEVGAIVLDINSGGGSVSGVSDTSDLIAQIDKKMKPVHTFSDGMIASAAYWLGSSARSIHIGKVTEAGSIGVITVHKEISKMLSDAGINATVLRAGEFKAMGNSFEPLSEKAKGILQAQLDDMYAMFVGHVAAARGVTYEVADKQMAQGQVFMGAKAVAAGLADKVSTFDAVVAKANQGIDLKKSSPQYGASFNKGPAMKVALTEQQIAAAAELGALNAVEKTAAEVAADKVAADAAVVAAAQAEADAAAAAAKDKPDTSADLVTFLKASLAEAQASVTSLTLDARDARAALADMTASHAPLRAIAVASVDRLKIAMGGSAGASDALSDTSLLAEHASLRADFEKKFKAGGVAAVSAAPADKVGDAVDPVRAARIASTRPSK